MILLRRVPFYFLLIFSLFFVVGCKKENPNPEQLDPIYNDLVKEYKKVESELKNERKNNEGLKKILEETEPRTAKRVSTQSDLRKSNKLVIQLQQKLKYLSIRKEHRRVVGRRAYKIAFKKGVPWPDPKEYKFYLLNKKLQEAPRNWDMRVPKLYQNNPNYNKVNKKMKEM